MIPNLFNVCQLFATIGVTIIVALFLSLLYTMFTCLVFYITELHKIQVRFLSQPFQISKAKWTPVLFNKIWYYRMHQKSSQFVSELILTLHFRCPCFLANNLFNVAPNVKWCVFCPVLSQSEAGALWLLYWKTREDPQGLYIVSFSGAKPTNRAINLIAFAFT